MPLLIMSDQPIGCLPTSILLVAIKRYRYEMGLDISLSKTFIVDCPEHWPSIFDERRKFFEAYDNKDADIQGALESVLNIIWPLRLDVTGESLNLHQPCDTMVLGITCVPNVPIVIPKESCAFNSQTMVLLKGFLKQLNIYFIHSIIETGASSVTIYYPKSRSHVTGLISKCNYALMGCLSTQIQRIVFSAASSMMTCYIVCQVARMPETAICQPILMVEKSALNILMEIGNIHFEAHSLSAPNDVVKGTDVTSLDGILTADYTTFSQGFGKKLKPNGDASCLLDILGREDKIAAFQVANDSECSLLTALLRAFASTLGSICTWSGQYQFTGPLIIILPFLPIAQAQTDLGGTGSFNTSTLGALYGVGLAAISVGKFPVINLTWTSEIWSRMVGVDPDMTEWLQVLWFSPRRWCKWNSPCPYFNGLGAHHIIVLGSEAPTEVTNGAWVCVNKSASGLIAGAETPRASQAGKCGGYHYWASSSAWWLALGLIPFSAQINAGYLHRNGCEQFTGKTPGATAQACGHNEQIAQVKHLRHTPTLLEYGFMDRPGFVHANYKLRVKVLMQVLAHADQAVISTYSPNNVVSTVWSMLAAGEGRVGEQDLNRIVSTEAITHERNSFIYPFHGSRYLPSSSIILHLVETITVILLPWFGITSLVMIEQVSRKATWSSLSSGDHQHIHACAYGGELYGEASPIISLFTLQGAPQLEIFWLLSAIRLILVISSYIGAIYIQVALHVNLPTYDDVLSIKAARAAGLTAASVHILTTVTILACLKRVKPCILLLLATALMTTIAILEQANMISSNVVGPTILIAEFISCLVQTTLNLAVSHSAPKDGWKYTINASCAETRVALILALPRLAAWLVVGS